MGEARYDEKFYDAIREGCQSSAERVVPAVIARLGYTPESVVDVGCGEGWWGQAFANAGVRSVVGVDSGDTEGRVAPDVEYVGHDLMEPLQLAGRYDLAVCLEVAEHLPEHRAHGLVSDLCAASKVVLFSAAMPRQGGTGHVNCQPPAYWAELFASEGYLGDGSIRWAIWDDPEVEPWYKSGLMLFTRIPRGVGIAPMPHEEPLHVIHPDLWLEPR